MTTRVAFRLSENLLARLHQLTGPSRSEVIRRALEEYIYRLECERDAECYAAVPPNHDRTRHG